MNKTELIKKIISKKEFSRLPKKDIELIFEKFDREIYADEEKIDLMRDLLRKVYSVFSSQKILNKKILDKKSPEEILKKHISTRERFNYYGEIYNRLLGEFENQTISIIDLGAGINGLTYNFFQKQEINVDYVGVEAVGQLVELMNYYFRKNKINGKAIHESLFNLNKIKEIIKKTKRPRIIFLFKVIDSLEMIEKDYSKEFLKGIVPLVEEVVVSFATRSLIKRAKFKAKRYWFENFIRKNFKILDNFILGGEQYFIFQKR